MRRLFGWFFRVLNKFVAWHRLYRWLGVLNLLAFRNDLRDHNLHDTSPKRKGERPEWDPEFRHIRTADGTFNDLSDPVMGSAGTRFGRNTPLDRVKVENAEDMLKPSPREVSRKLMTRDVFKPATTLNLLAAAWIQFQNHDWFNHQRIKDQYIEVDLQPDDDWHENPMRIRRGRPDPTRTLDDAGLPPTFINTETHWWDASQLYGSNSQIQKKIRSHEDGKLRIEKTGFLPLDDEIKAAPGKGISGIDLTGLNDNWWMGLSLLHTLFAMEHNVICDHLKREYPHLTDDRLFHKARLINAALIAKIHTVEWTPGILAHPALQIAMNGNWDGLIGVLLGSRFRNTIGRIGDGEVWSGIPGSKTDHHSAPYYLTEEFTSVYRLHPLIPDEVTLRCINDHSRIKHLEFTDVQGNNTRPSMEGISFTDLFYSFGVSHPGAITLHNFPAALQNLETVDGFKLDLAAIDIMRDRERAVPRYNDFREMLRMPRIKSFKQITSNAQWAKEIEEVYNGDIDRVDLQVGMQAEPLPEGFGFSDTAFRIFVLMASRRLKSDRFFTTDFTPEVYTPLGIKWIEDNNMRSVLLRHFPELSPALFRSKNAFAPWSRVK